MKFLFFILDLVKYSLPPPKKKKSKIKQVVLFFLSRI